MNRPADYIEVESIKIPQRHTITADIHNILRRFHNQEFKAIHVIVFMSKMAEYKDYSMDKLSSNVRSHLAKMGRSGELEVIKQGKPGVGHFSIYRNKP